MPGVTTTFFAVRGSGCREQPQRGFRAGGVGVVRVVYHARTVGRSLRVRRLGAPGKSTQAGGHYFRRNSERKRSRHGAGHVAGVDRGRCGDELVHFSTEMLYTEP